MVTLDTLSSGQMIVPYPLYVSGCGTNIKLTRYFLIIACPGYSNSMYTNQGKIFIFLRETYDAIFEIAGASSQAFFGTKMQVIESADGLQL
jgi:hypothetical protein